MEHSAKNVEIKVRMASLESVRAIARTVTGREGIVEHQCDTYFHAPQGRLKLREIEGQRAVLIGYMRPNESEARVSQYTLVPIPDPGSLKIALAGTLGIRGEIRKRREIYFWKNVRIHLDVVQGLGEFVELEAVLDAEHDEVGGRADVAELCVRLGLRKEDRIAQSYADLLRL